MPEAGSGLPEYIALPANHSTRNDYGIRCEELL